MDSDEEAAQATADFVRNDKERRRSRLDGFTSQEDLGAEKDEDAAKVAAAEPSDEQQALAAATAYQKMYVKEQQQVQEEPAR